MSSGVVSFVANGTCTLNFNDPWNANYAVAPTARQTFTVTTNVEGNYSGGSSSNIPSSPGNCYLVTATPGGSSSTLANTYTSGVATTLTQLTFTMNSSSGSNDTVTVGIVSGGVGNATTLSCTVVGGSNNESCTVTTSVALSAGASISLYAVGNANHSGTWTINYTKP